MIEVKDAFMDGEQIQVHIDDRDTTIILCFNQENYQKFKDALPNYYDLTNCSPNSDPRTIHIQDCLK